MENFKKECLYYSDEFNTCFYFGDESTCNNCPVYTTCEKLKNKNENME